MKNLKFCVYPTMALLFLCFALGPLPGLCAEKPSEVKQVAILPFKTITSKNISYITAGTLSMLHSRLTWKNHVATIPDRTVNSIAAENSRASGNIAALTIGKAAGADYLISGTITEFYGAFSIDTKVYNLENNMMLTFFDQCKTINEIPSKIDVVAAKINKKVFDRTTVSYEKFKKQRVITEEELRRINPERMMPGIPLDNENDKPWWKIW